MIRRRAILTAAAIVFACVIGFIRHACKQEPAQTPFELQPGAAYAIDVAQGGATFDLDFVEHEEYLLIVGSLGSGERRFSVELRAEPTSELSMQPMSHVAPMTFRRQKTTTIDSASNVVSEVQSGDVSTREFYIHVTDGTLENPLAYQRVRAKLIAEGKAVRVYLDRDQSERELSRGLADELVRLFDEEIQPRSRELLGDHVDVDGDGKFSILLTHWLGKLQGGRTSLGGFVRGSDFQSGMSRPFSNQADMMYLNSQIRPGRSLRTLLAHEYTHAILFSARLAYSESIGEEDWLNEAIAHIAENLQSRDWSNLDHRINAFAQNPAECPLVIPDYYRSGRWRDHGCRGATYLFLRWCVDTHGRGLVRSLIDSPSRGTRNVERATQQPFAQLFRHWLIAIARDSLCDRISTGQDTGDLQYLSLRQRVGDYRLDGVACDRRDVARPCPALSACGTAGRFVVLSSSKDKSVHRISITAEASAKLQLTLIPLPREESSLPSRQPPLTLAEVR